MIYISTRNRLDNIAKVIPHWLEQKQAICLILESGEMDAHDALIHKQGWGERVLTACLPEDNRGLGYSRNYAIQFADTLGQKSIIVSDDDLFPSRGTDVSKMLDFVSHPKRKRLGCGVTTSYHGLMMGNDLLKTDQPVLCPSGWGFRMYSLNVQYTLELGNFDKELPCLCEDAELTRHGIAAGTPWFVHTGVRATSIGKRHEPGGMMGLFGTEDKRREREYQCHELVYERWPAYVSNPAEGKKYRMAWAKMLDDCIHNWRQYSVIHGGEYH